MCDCYHHKCEECEETIPWHIRDFAYPREQFSAWCPEHESTAPKSAIRFDIRSGAHTNVETPGIWAICGPPWGGNNPNCDYALVKGDDAYNRAQPSLIYNPHLC